MCCCCCCDYMVGGRTAVPEPSCVHTCVLADVCSRVAGVQDLLALCTRVVRGLFTKLCPPLAKVEEPPSQGIKAKQADGKGKGELVPEGTAHPTRTGHGRASCDA
jgi:hypothetical protein